MVLQALEFSDCLLDSPHFRERLNAHEKELDNTSRVIKKLIQEGKDLISAAKNYAKCQRTFAATLMDFKFETIGSQQTDEEIVISKSLKSFGEIITSIEEARDTMMERIKETFVDKLDDFRKHHIVSAKDERKRFEKTTKQYCTAVEKHLSLKPAKSADGQIQESDSSIETDRRVFNREAMAYVMKLQEVQERKKFEFVEILLAFMYGWKTFYHQGHETGTEMDPYMTDLGVKLNKTRENFESTRSEATTLMQKMLDKPAQESASSASKMFTRQGYLYAMEKKALGTISWIKYFCSYQKEAKIFTMIPFHQTTSNAGKLNLTPDTMALTTCVRRATESIDRRFCFDICIHDRPGMTLQALSDVDRQQWLEAMDGKEPVYAQPVLSKDSQEYSLDKVGFTFVHKCIDGVESRGITDQGLYRVVGVSSKVHRLTLQGLDPKKIDKLNLSDSSSEFEVKTITSALKNYFRKLSEPVMTFSLHQKLISAAKLESRERRISEISGIVHLLPADNFKILSLIIKHLSNVAAESSQNMMSISNLSVCFGPTLLRPEEETVAAIMDIKFCNLVVEILIENCETIFAKGSKSNGLPAESVNLRLNSGECKTPTKTYSEDSTYGKHRPSYRASSVYANIPLTTSPTRLDQPAASVFSPVRPSNLPPARPNHFVTAAGGVRVSPGPNNGGNCNNNSITITVDSRLIDNSNQSQDVDSKMYNNAQIRSDLYASKSPSSRGGGRILSNPVLPSQKSTVECNIKPMYANVPQKNVKSSSHITAANNLSAANPSYSNSMSKSYAGVSSSAFQPTQQSSVPGPGAPLINRRVRTLYACDAENESELSFQPNEIIYNVRESREPGWLEGTLNGKVGLLPANYIEYMN